MLKNSSNNNLAFKCTWNDSGFKGVCTQQAYQYNLSKNRAWCLKAPCRTFEKQLTDEDHPCYESILFTHWRFGAGWDHKDEKRPREIKRAQIGKIAIVTTLGPDEEEDERRIIGFFKINKIDKGEEQETIVYGDPSQSLEINPRITMHFWNYYTNPNAPDKKRWGTGLFRYVEDRTVCTFLKDLKELYIKNNLSSSDVNKISEIMADFGNVPSPSSSAYEKRIVKQPGVLYGDNKKICDNCGHTNYLTAKFCNQCGRELSLVCGQCKATNPPGSNYCCKCGSKVNSTKHYSPESVRDKLLEYGIQLKSQEHEYYFTPDKDAEALIFEDSNAFLFAVIFDQGIDAEKAWAAPYEIKKRMGHLDIHIISEMSEREIGEYLRQKPKLHRFWPTMGRRLKKACIKIKKEYSGKALNIWKDKPDSIVLVKRLESFEGVGQKKASMAANILYRDIDVEIHNISGIDVSYDVMVRRVFLRT